MMKFEIRYHVKQLSFLLACFLFLILGAFIAIRGNFGDGELYKNSVYVTTYIISFLSLFSIFSATLFCANVVMRDSVYRMESIVFTSTIDRFSYFFVRFSGLMFSVFIHLCFAAFGLWLGSFLVNPTQVGDYHLGYYIHPLFLFGFPNVLLSSACMFSTALLTRNVRAIYAAGVLLYIIYMVASILGNSPLFAGSLKVNDPGIWPYLLDPFGLTSFFDTTRNWTDMFKNDRYFPVGGIFAVNRLLWLSISLVLLNITYRLFRFRLISFRPAKLNEHNLVAKASARYTPKQTQPNGVVYFCRTFLAQFRLESLSLFKHIPFMVILLLWLFVFSIELKDTLFNGAYGIRAIPTTGFIVEEMRAMNLALLLLIFFAAEISGRERVAKIEGLIYSTPVRPGVLWAAKCAGLIVLIVVLVTLNILIGIGTQLVNGYYQIELPVYFSLYYYSAVPLFLFAILIFGVQNMIVNRYMGMLVNMIVVSLAIFSAQFGLKHYMLRFATAPAMQHSAFNGFGHYETAFNWYMAYWTGFAILIALLSIGMWQTGTLHTFSERTKMLWKTLYTAKYIGIASLLLSVSSGSYIYYQSNVVGGYKSSAAALDDQVEYEKRYTPYIRLPQPVIKKVKTTVTLLTKSGSYLVKGNYVLKNESEQPIDRVWINLDPSVNRFELSIAKSEAEEADQRFKQQFFKLHQPLMPGAEMGMDFDLELVRNGFVPFNNENAVVHNGSYVELEKYVPHLGFDEDRIIQDKAQRKRTGLPVTPPSNPIDYNYHLIDFETTVATAVDQTVVTVGELQRAWRQGDQQYFHYKAIRPIRFMFALSSARYELKQETHRGMPIRIYYLKGQEYHLETMMRAIRETLDYGNAHFGAYSFSQFTLAEIPHYRGAATAYPGLIFSAEQINFLSDYDKRGQVNQAYAITAHEVAHQWWAQQLDPVKVAGSATLTESLAKYTEAVRMEHTFGKQYLSNYFKLDNRLYFIYHNPNEKEETLAQTVDQNFVYYQKGGLVMYAIKEAVGEQAFNNVLKRLIQTYQAPNRKATMADFERLLLSNAPENQKSFIIQSLSQVVNYDLSVKMRKMKRMDDGRYQVELVINGRINSAEHAGALTPDMDVDLAFFAQPRSEWSEKAKPIYLKKIRINKLATILTVLLDRKPTEMAVDPYGYLLDIDLSNNYEILKPQ